MPRVLLVFEHPTLNGGERSLLAVLPFLQRAGYSFDALCFEDGPLTAALAVLKVDHILPVIEGEGSTTSVRREAIGLVLSSFPYDLVHANSLTTGRLSGPVVAEAGVPSIAHLRDIVGLKGPAVADLNRHSRLIAVSRATREFHVAQGVDGAKVCVVFNGVNLDLFTARTRNRKRGAEPTRRTIGIVGQIILRKGQEVSLAAAVDVMRSRPDLEVVVLGARHSEKLETREYEARLHGIVADAGMTDRVRFLGTRDDVAELMPTWDLLLHTPRQEPLGRVLLEAAACGVPIVATDVGGTREIFPGGEEDGATLVQVDDVNGVAVACERLLDDDELSAAVGANGRRRIETVFNVERAAAELLRHYEEVAAK